jgi:hypothetical protein
MNDDNLRFVNLARLLHKKLAVDLRQRIPAPTLLSKPCPRLLGSDGKKMAKANANDIHFMDDEHVIAEQLRNYARRLGWRWTRGSTWAFEGNDSQQKLRPDSPLVTILLAFGLLHDSAQPRIGDAPQLIEAVVAVALPFMSAVRARTQETLLSKHALWSRFESDNARAVQRIGQTLEALIE